MFWIILVAQALAFGGFCAFIAREKNRDAVSWFLLGFLFSLIALLALIALPKLEEPVQRPVHEDQPPSQLVPSKATSAVSTLFNIFAAPGEVFESIKAAPKKGAMWVLPCVFAVVIGIIFTFVVFSDPSIQAQMRETMEKQLDKQIAEGKIPPERAEAARQGMERMTGGAMFRVFGSIGTIVYVVGSLLVVSLALFLVGKFVFKAAAPYGKVMEVVGPSFMINFVLGSIVTMLTMLAMGSLYATPGLALVIGEFNPENKAHLLLSSINVFTI